ncbi:MAG: HAMP domain-containing sensor histidine kinase [Bacteroidota bacterium]
MKTQFKIALILILSNTLIILMFGGAIFYFLYNYSYSDFYKRLETRAKITARHSFQDGASAEQLKQMRNEYLERLSNEQEYVVRLDSLGSQGASAYDLPSAFVRSVLRDNKATYQIGTTFYSGIVYLHNKNRYLVAVSAQNYYAANHLSFLGYTILAAVAFITIIISYLSVYFARHIFDPISTITRKVKTISAENMHLRLDEDHNDNEVSRLSSTFNELLSRVETAFETQKNFISNASHEFGTPLTAIMGEAEVMLMKDRDPEDYRRSLKSILEQAERLNDITQSLLVLAQTGGSRKSIMLEPLRVDELVWASKVLLNRINPKSQVQLDFELLPEDPARLTVLGSKHLLQLALTNILGNGSKYSGNQPVELSMASGNNQVIITITDHGIGIPEDEIPYIYDPFFRASNTTSFEGYGIGLPLTRNIIRLHNGKMDVFSKIGEGTTVQLKLPVMPKG